MGHTFEQYYAQLSEAKAAGYETVAEHKSAKATTTTDTSKGRSGSYLRNSIKDRKTNSFQNYLSGKQKHGSSSAWYDSAAEEEKKQKTLVEKLQNQIKYREQNDWANSIGGGLDSLSPFQNTPSENYQSIEDLQKQLEQAERDLKRATEELGYASEWRYYDADMAWLDNVNKSGQDWGSISDALATMTERTNATYDEALKALQQAEQQNKRIDQLRRQGGVPSELEAEYTDEAQLAEMRTKLEELDEMRGMAERRYTYSLDELAKDSSITEWGRIRAQGIAEQDEKAYSEHINELIRGAESGEMGVVSGVDVYTGNTRDYRPTDAWSQDQLNRYYVILNRQGEEAAGKYAVDVNTYNNLEAQQQATEGAYSFGKARSLDGAEGFWGHVGAGVADTGRGLAGTALNVLSMPEQLFEYVDKANRVAATGAYTGNAQPGMSDYGEAISRGRAETLNERYSIGGKGAGDLYQLTNSMAQSLVYGNLAGSAGTLTLFFGTAANQGFDDAMSRGADPEQALTFGMFSGIAEAAAESVPLNNLLNADKALTRGFLKSAMIQAGFEGLEEGATDVLNTIADQLVMGDKSTINSAITARMQQGESYEQAAKAEWGNYVKNVVWDMIGGAISGAGSSAIQYGVNMASPYKVDAEGRSLYGTSAKTLAQEAQEVKDNKKLNALGKQAEDKLNKGKSISNATAQKLAKGTNRAAMLQSTEAQIKERFKDVKEEDIQYLTHGVVSVARGERPGPMMQRTMDKYRDTADTLISELDLGKANEERADWAKDIGGRGIEATKLGNKDVKDFFKSLSDEKSAANTDADAVEDMSAPVTIPTKGGEITGTVSGIKTGQGMPQFIIRGEDGKDSYVNADEAINSGALPAGMARLAYQSLGLGDTAADVYRLYSTGQDVNEYVNAMDDAMSIAADVSSRAAFDKSDAAQMLTNEQRDYAWQQGQQKRDNRRESQSKTQTQRKKKSPRKRGTVSYDGAIIGGVKYKATPKDKIKAADLRVIERIAKAANVDVVFYESDSIDGMYQGANGFYSDGTVYLDVHAAASKTTQQDAILLTAAHELTHHIRANAAAQYDALKEFIVERLLEDGQDFETLVQSKRTEKGMSRADAVEEVIADACEMVLKDSKAVEKLAKENKSLAQTIADWLHGFYEDIKAAFEGVEARSKEAKAMTDYMDELVKLWDDALVEASKNESKPSGKVKEQARSTKNNKQGEIDKYFIRQIEQWDGQDHGGSFRVGKVSNPLLMVGMPDVDIWFDQSKAAKQLSEKEEITKEELKRIPEILNNPIAIAESYDNTVLVFGEMYDEHGNPIVIAIRINSTNRRNHITVVNKVRSIGSRKNNLDKLLAEENILYLKPNKKETNNWFNALGRSTPFGGTKFGLIRIITGNARNDNSKVNYSRRDSSEGLTKEEARAQAQAYTQLKAENAALKRRLDYWQGQTKRTKQRTINRGDVDKYANQLIKMHGSEVDKDWLKQKLRELGDYLVQSDELDWDVLHQMAWEISTAVIENAEVEDDSSAYDNKNDIVDDIKGYRFHLNEMYKNDLPEGFRKRYSGKLHISYTDGRSVDSIYENLQRDYGKTLFPDMPTQADMLVMIGDAYDTVTTPPAVYNPYQYHMNETITSVSYDILDMMMSEEIRQTAPTAADKAASKLDQQKAADRRKLNQVRADKNARIAEIRRQETAKRQEAVAKEKAKKYEKVAAVREYYQSMIQRQRETRRENAAAKKYRDSAYDKASTLMDWLIKNSDKEHIPEALKAPIIELLSTIDLSSRQMLKKGEATRKDETYTKKMQQLRDILSRQQAYMQKPGEADGLDVFLDLPDGFDETIKQHIDSVDAILNKNTDAWNTGPIAYMTAAQLEDLDFILTTLTTSIKQINKFITDSHYASVIEGAQDSMRFLREMGAGIDRSITKERADQFLAWTNALPIYVFKRFGPAGQERFGALINGWGKMAMNVQAAIKYAEETYSAEEVKAWEETVREITLTSGSTARMTEAQMMGLYCSYKREQARGHLLAGGMRVADIEPNGVLKKKIRQTDAFQLTNDDVINIAGMLSERQIEVADKLQSYFNTTCAQWGNEVSMARFGYRQFTESNYYPITTDQNNHPAADPKARETDIFRLLNMSATKALTPNANNSIVIFSIFDVFSAHTADMAKYNALALPILDLLKWYNYKDKQYSDVTDSMGETNTQLRVDSVQGSVERTYGKAAQNYILNFLKDLNGVREGGRNEQLLKGSLGKYKSAAVAANFRVAIQQPTSIVRASYMINPKYLAQGAAMKGGVEEAMKYSGLAVWKSMGYFDTNISRNMRQQIKHADTQIDKIREKSMKLAELGDKVTWGAIWNACKLEQQETKGLSGDELMKATNERFSEIILSTQVLDSTISRSDIMRQQSLAVSELTSFMSEPTVSYNILMDSAMQFEMTRRQTGSITEARKKNWPMMGRALAVYGLTATATAAAAAIVDAMRDDDEYQNFIEKWWEHVKDNLEQGINPINLVPIVGEIINVALGKETHESMLFQPVTQLSKAWTAGQDLIRDWFKSDKELNEPSRTNWGRLYQVAQAVSSLSGLPVAGFMREFKTVWNMSIKYVTGKTLKTYDSGVKNSVKYGVLDGYIEEEEAVALLVDSGEYSNPDDAYWQVQEWVHADDSEWTRYNDVFSAVLADDMEAFALAQDMLGDHGVPAKSVRTTVKSQIGRWFIGGEDMPVKMDEATALKALQQYAGLIKIEAQHLLDEWKFEKKEGVRWADLKDAYVSGKYTAEQVKTFLTTYGHEYSKDAGEKVMEWTCEKETGIAFNNLCDAFIHKEITEGFTVDSLVKYGGENRADAEMKVAQWGLAEEYGIRFGSTDAGIKKALIEGYISDETAKAIMVAFDNKTWEEAEDYVNQYHFTEETGYNFSEIEEAFADGVIDYDEMVDWYTKASIYSHGSVEVATEYADVAVWKKEVPRAERMNRDGLEKWTDYGEKYLGRVGLGREDFAAAWKLYSTSYSEYDIYGNKAKEKAEVFFERLYKLYQDKLYSLDEVKAMAKSIYSTKYINKYAPW